MRGSNSIDATWGPSRARAAAYKPTVAPNDVARLSADSDRLVNQRRSGASATERSGKRASSSNAKVRLATMTVSKTDIFVDGGSSGASDATRRCGACHMSAIFRASPNASQLTADWHFFVGNLCARFFTCLGNERSPRLGGKT